MKGRKVLQVGRGSVKRLPGSRFLEVGARVLPSQDDLEQVVSLFGIPFVVPRAGLISSDVLPVVGLELSSEVLN